MKNITKILVTLGVSTTAVLGANAVSAQTTNTGTAAVSADVTFNGSVPLECAVVGGFASPTNTPFVDTIESLTTTGTGGNETLGTGTGIPGDIDRTTVLKANVDVAFDCNTATVSINVVNTDTTTPTDAPADLTVSQNLTVTPSPGIGVVNSNVLLGDFTFFPSIPTNGTGDISVNVDSEFVADNEELPEGDYSAGYTVTVTAL